MTRRGSTLRYPDADPRARWAYRSVLLDSLVHEFNAMRGVMGEPDSLEFADIRETGVTAIFKYGPTQCILAWVDLPAIARFFRLIVAAGETYAYPEDLDDQGIADLWMSGRCVVAENGAGEVVGSATMGPNRPGRGAHIATASFMVDPAAQGQGIGRALGEELLRWRPCHGVYYVPNVTAIDGY